jgi:ring-1,2-phenylacetyl-CoA epoxidase subunit PaaD
MNTPIQPSTADVWAWLAGVEDPEIPVLSVLDLGIVRDVRWSGEADAPVCVVTITPTYSGCPATEVIAQSIRDTLKAQGLTRVHLQTQIAPAWTTDWLSDDGRRKLREYGIAPPTEQAISISAIGRGARPVAKAVACPRCNSEHTQQTSPFGSTPCKALYRCLDCLEPFDSFKCH